MEAIFTVAKAILGLPNEDRNNYEFVRAVNLGTAILLGITVLFAYGLLYVFMGEPACAFICLAGGALCLVAAGLYRVRSSVPFVREFLLTVIFVVIICLSYKLGGVRSPALVWLATCPTIAAVVGGNTGRVWSLMALFGVLGFYLAPMFGVQIPPVLLTDGHFALIYAISAVSLTSTVAIFALLSQETNRAAFRQVRQLASVDELTSLPNRRFMREVLEVEDRRHRTDDRNFSLALIDIDFFKQINDNYGHGVGDAVLREFARRASDCLRSADILSRWGGEEFLLLLPGTDQAAAAAVVDRLREEILGMTINEGPAAIRLSFSAGVAEAGPGRDIGDAIRQCDIALGVAKSEGRNTVRVFDGELQAEVTRRDGLRNDMQRGLEQGEFVLHYQPQLDRAEKLIGAEALLRWQHRERGLVPPSGFIALAEENGLILDLGEFVLLQACKQLAHWSQGDETKNLTISVNVSGRQLKAPGFLQQVIFALKSTGANPLRLTLELTESILLGVTPETLRTVHALRDLGLRLSLDDFGTGYSSMNYLKQLPLQELKIDRSFIDDIITESKDSAIAETILALGRALGLHIVAEGVESAAQRDFLASRGCDGFQGYLYSPALPIEDFLRLSWRWLDAGKREGVSDQLAQV